MRFSHDRRGQSVVIGTVILFGFLILALSLYQVQVVPQQNGQVEFQHFEEVRNDLVELRAGILQAGSTDRPQYQTVRLGTTYPTRIFAINPPSPAGTIRTTQSYPIVISNGTPEGTVTVSTRFLQYRPGYNEIDQSPTWYDASVLYADARDEGGGIAVIEDQALVTDNGDVRIIALQNEFRRSGTGRMTVELRPTENVSEPLPEGNLTVTVPTRLSGDNWQNKTDLPTNSDVYGGVTDDANDDDVYNLTLNTVAENLTVDTVGVQETPEDPIQSSGRGGDGDGDDASGINPGGPTDIVLESVNRGSSREVDFVFRNEGTEDREFRSMQFTLYYRSQGSAQQSVTLTGPGARSQEFPLRGEFVDLEPPIPIPGDGTATVTLTFDEEAQGDLIGVSFGTDLGRQQLYIAGFPQGGNPSGGQGQGQGQGQPNIHREMSAKQSIID